MTNNNNQVSVTYTDAQLRNLVEEFITQRKEGFSLRDACSYILYWAVEDDKVADGNNLIVGTELQTSDQERVKRIIDSVALDGRLLEDGYKWLMKSCSLRA